MLPATHANLASYPQMSIGQIAVALCGWEVKGDCLLLINVWVAGKTV